MLRQTQLIQHDYQRQQDYPQQTNSNYPLNRSVNNNMTEPITYEGERPYIRSNAIVPMQQQPETSTHAIDVYTERQPSPTTHDPHLYSGYYMDIGTQMTEQKSDSQQSSPATTTSYQRYPSRYITSTTSQGSQYANQPYNPLSQQQGYPRFQQTQSSPLHTYRPNYNNVNHNAFPPPGRSNTNLPQLNNQNTDNTTPFFHEFSPVISPTQEIEGLYSLWNGENNGNMMNYDAESERTTQTQVDPIPTLYSDQVEMKLSPTSQMLPTNSNRQTAYATNIMDYPLYNAATNHSAQSSNSGYRTSSQPWSSGTQLLVSTNQYEGDNSTTMSQSPSTAVHNRQYQVVQQRRASNASSVGSDRRLSVDSFHSATSKRPRSKECEEVGCSNRARSHGRCKRHGGAHQCTEPGCKKNSQSRGKCIAHGGGSRCKALNCGKASQSRGLCKSHGGGEFCAVEGCQKKAHLRHLCRNHGGGERCKEEECNKWAQRKGWCMAHAKQFIMGDEEKM